jgi:hypothetical protein
MNPCTHACTYTPLRNGRRSGCASLQKLYKGLKVHVMKACVVVARYVKTFASTQAVLRNWPQSIHHALSDHKSNLAVVSSMHAPTCSVLISILKLVSALGSWTLTTTSRPSLRRALWACPIEAVPRGTGSIHENTSAKDRPRLDSITPRTTLKGSEGQSF